MFLLNNFIYVFMAVLGLHCCTDFSLVVVCRLLIAVTSLVEHRGCTGLLVVAHGLRHSTTCGISLDQGLNLCLLYRQVDSLPLSRQGRPTNRFLKTFSPL